MIHSNSAPQVSLPRSVSPIMPANVIEVSSEPVTLQVKEESNPPSGI